ncbi:hypothetical protein BD779DRAFT_113803 [Infundibulicybe gibba]|nr:hypothetical protein BD779DRAFT_113803 [Infundibulicybe gibba]
MCEILELANLTLGAPTTPPLPSEIFDLVIDQLKEDRTTLMVCSLVCRSWLPRTRHHLFSTFSVRTISIPPIDLLRSPLCTIQPHELVNEDSNLFSLSIRTSLGSGMTLVDDHLRALLSAHVFKNLHHLKLKYLRFENLNDSIGLYSSLPALESLVLHGVDSCVEDDQHIYTMPPPPNLRHLFIWAIGVPHELCWLTAHPRHPLKTLHLHSISSAGYPIVLDYLRQSSQLQCLSFNLDEWATLGLVYRLDISTGSSLSSHQLCRGCPPPFRTPSASSLTSRGNSYIPGRALGLRLGGSPQAPHVACCPRPQAPICGRSAHSRCYRSFA